MSEMPAISSARSGARRRARATLVSGPTATIHSPGSLRHDSTRKATASSESAGRRGFVEVGAVETAGTVDVAGGDLLGEQRTRRAGVHGCVDGEQLAHHEGVVRGPRQRGVAGHRRDPDELAQVGGDDDGDGVVVTGVAVEDDPWP